MKNVLRFMTVFIVALVAFGGWYGSNAIGAVEAEFAPSIATKVAVFEAATVNIVVVWEVEKTTTAEVLPLAILVYQDQATADQGNSVMTRNRHQRSYRYDPVSRLWNDNRYMAYYGLSARRTVIGRTMRYLA